MRNRSAYPPQLFVLAVLALVSFTIQLRLSANLIADLFFPASTPSPTLAMTEGKDRIAWAGPNAKKAGLEADDRVLTVDDRPYSGEGGLASAIAAAGPGGSVKLRTMRGDDTRQVLVLIAADQPPSKKSIVINLIYRLVTPLFCLALGFFVAFQRPFDKLAWIVLGLMASFSQASGGGLMRYAYAWDDWLRPVAIFFIAVCLSTWPIAMLWFGTFFPVPSRLEQKWPWLKWLLIAPVSLWGIVRITTAVISVQYGAAPALLQTLNGTLGRYVFIFFSIPISFFFMQLGEKSGTLPSKDARRRIKLIWMGTMFSLTPMFVLALIGFIRGGELDSLPEWFVIPALLLQLLFPITLAYVIVVQRAMDVRMALRLGLRYTLARSGVAVTRGILIGALIGFIIFAAVQWHVRGVQLIALICLGVIGVLFLRRIFGRVSRWVDRRFFRETYAAEQILADLSDEVRTIVETQPLLQTVGTRLSESLHVPKVSLLLKYSDGYRPAYSHGFAEMPRVAFADDSGIVRQLRDIRGPVMIYRDDPDSWTRDLTVTESDELSKLDSELVLPMAVKDKLHGFIALGQKQSEEPYSGSDVKLLQSVAAQTGLALENAQLTAVVATEVAQRERLNRELEIAREVQERLFPQKYPAVPGLDYAGHCRPAQGVGGDYYDFVEVPGGAFGIAIGDISGKGIPAALLMASLQASLRGQAITGPTDLAALMNNMNRLIFDTSPSNRYATFFYGQYNPQSRIFTYVNGGHNAPMVCRNGDVIRLEDGGPPVGLFSAASYSQSTVELHPGDVLVGFTDGISEAMNHADDEFGEERMIPVIEEGRTLSANVIIDRLFVAADVFADGAPQHDDMTAIVVRVLDVQT